MKNDKLRFKKSSFSQTGCDPKCVEVAISNGKTFIRDSKQGETGEILSFTSQEWTAFVKGVKNGEFD